MLDFRHLLLSLLLSGSLFGCGEASVSVIEGKEGANESQVEIPEKSLAAFHTLRDARLQAGDTVAIADSVLKMLVDDSLPGFSLEIDKSATFTTRNFTFSEATKVFYDSLENYRELTAGDYSANPDFFEVLIDRFNQATEGTGEGLIERRIGWRPAAIPQEMDFFGWETYHPSTKIAQANFGLDYRYFVSVEGTGASGFFVREKLDQLIHWAVLAQAPR